MAWKDFLPQRIKKRRHIQRLKELLEQVDAEYDSKLKALQKDKGRYNEEYEGLRSEADFMRSEYMEEIESIESKDLLVEARRYQVDLSDIPPPPEGSDSHWEQRNFGHRFLTSAASNALGKAVYKARREHDKERREKATFWFGIAVGIFGMLITIYNTFVTSGRLSDLTNRITALEKAIFPPGKH